MKGVYIKILFLPLNGYHTSSFFQMNCATMKFHTKINEAYNFMVYMFDSCVYHFLSIMPIYIETKSFLPNHLANV